MAKEKPDKKRRRTGATIAASYLQTMQGLAAAVGLTTIGATILSKLPHGFDSLEEGMGKKPMSNKRVLLIAAALVWCIMSKNIKRRLWSIPLAALLTVAVAQHKATYQAEEAGKGEDDGGYIETYE